MRQPRVNRWQCRELFKRTTGLEPATFGLGSRGSLALGRGIGGGCDWDATLISGLRRSLLRLRESPHPLPKSRIGSHAMHGPGPRHGAYESRGLQSQG